MARLEGNKPNSGAIIIGAVIFALIAGGLFFAFRPVPEPTDVTTTSNAATSGSQSSSGNSDAAVSTNSNETSENSLTTITTPLPMATPTPARTGQAPAFDEADREPPMEPLSVPTPAGIPEPSATAR